MRATNLQHAALLMVLLLVSQPAFSYVPPPQEPRVASSTAAPGLNMAERANFYHLSEGSEVFPLSWLRALNSKQTGKPFLEDMERFGLIADPGKLPVGISADTTRDLGYFKGFTMVGVNCAACHVSQITYKGNTLRIDGAPAKFDLHAFYQDLFTSASDLSDPSKFIAFFLRFIKGTDAGTGAFSARQRTVNAMVLERADSLEKLEAGDPYDKQFIRTLEKQLEEDRQRFNAQPLQLEKDFVVAPETHPLGGTSEWKILTPDEVKKLSEKEVGEPKTTAKFSTLNDSLITGKNRMGALGANHQARTELFNDFGTGVRDNYRLFLARLRFLEVLKKQAGITTTIAGYGRVDAFGNARNLLWPRYQVNTTSPVSYPHLWGFTAVDYLHWDANTTSVIERNMGQALGLGAVFDPVSFVSTISPRHLHDLEVLAAKLQPPAWPEAVLGSIDRDKFKRGAQLFRQHCESCHSSDPSAENLFPPSKTGTDAARADNFAIPLGGQGFDVAIETILGKIKAQSYKDSKVTAQEAAAFDGKPPKPGMPKWRVTRQYSARSLRGVWATAPYLHNNSVLNLHELLLPANQRLTIFYTGCVEYNPVNVGFVSDPNCRPGDHRFDTSQVGNRNTGHEYGTTMTELERMDLLEFLKAY